MLLSCPTDAEDAASHVKHCLEIEWRREAGPLSSCTVRTLFWREDPVKAWSLDGGQGAVNESLLREADLVVAVFLANVGTPWVETTTGRQFASGTIAEILMARDLGKPALVYASSEVNLSGFGKVTNGSVLSTELAQELNELATQKGLAIRSWDSLVRLGHLVKQDLTAHIRNRWITIGSLANDGLDQALPITVGSTWTKPNTYQVRNALFDAEEAWAAGETLVWLTGEGGLGKTFLARSIWDEALHDDSNRSSCDLVIWVDGANRSSILAMFADAARRLKLGVPEVGGYEREEQLAYGLLQTLENATWPWLVVLDNANIDDIVSANLIPPRSPVGRVLVTTLELHPNMRRYGRTVSIGPFDENEAHSFIRSLTATSSEDEDLVPLLADAVGRHPLALSVAVAAIDEASTTISSWLASFMASRRLDETLSEADPHGYPGAIHAVHAIALDKASRGQPSGQVERAALIAALLDPAGHPGNFWDLDSVNNWIGLGSPVGRRLGGLPNPLYRLRRFSLVEFDTSPWPSTIVRMHQVTAMALTAAVHEAELEEAIDLAIEGLTQVSEGTPTEIRLAALNMVHLLTRQNFVSASALERHTPSAVDALRRLRVRGLSSEATEGLAQLVHITTRFLGNRAEATMSARFELGLSAGDDAQYPRAIQTLNDLLDDQYSLGADSAVTLETRECLAWIIGISGRMADAVPMLEAIIAEATIELGPNHPVTLINKKNLAYFVGAQGETTEALASLAEIIPIASRVFPPEHKQMLAMRHNFAWFLGRAGSIDDASEQLDRLVMESAKALGPSHPDTLRAQEAKSELLENAGRVREALDVQESILSIQTDAFGPTTQDSMRSRYRVAVLHGMIGDQFRAVRELQAVLEDQMQVLGPNHPEVVATRTALIRFLPNP